MSEPPEPATDTPISSNKRKPAPSRGHALTTHTITTPPFSYALLELQTSQKPSTQLDELTVRTYLTSALTQFLGLSGAAIVVDVLKVEVERGVCWVRVPRGDLSVFLAAVGGWIGRGGAGEG
ncbi:hypothetical protein LSUE1_G001031, partial [Lachnellula suecica]